mmetsp:Transcript_22780/g.40619  ORF Transcript_22780/g.40619 Transcript_22780/m.40619 type:complete len:122 (-) Transcript_22780:418-783(-)
MLLNTATLYTIITLLAATLVHGVRVLDRPAPHRVPTSFAPRRVTSPALHRPTEALYPDIDCVSEEIDGIIESSLATTRLSRSREATEDRTQRRPLVCKDRNKKKNDEILETDETVDFPYWL